MFLIKSGIMSLSKNIFILICHILVRIRVRFKIKARFSISVKDSVRIGMVFRVWWWFYLSLEWKVTGENQDHGFDQC